MLIRCRLNVAFALGSAMTALLAPAAEAQNIYSPRTNQPQIVTLTRFSNKTGEYLGMSGNYMICMLDGGRVTVQLDKNSKVKVAGSATADALAPGMYVQFKGTFDRHGKGTEPIKDVEIYTPDPNHQPGAYEAGGSSFDEHTPGKKKGPVAATTMYQISGRITAAHKNTISVDCGNLKVKAEITPDAAVRIETTDLSWASSGDKINISGLVGPALGAGHAICSDATIELAAQLTGKKKSHVAHVSDKATDKAPKADKADKPTDKTDKPAENAATDKSDKAVDKATDKSAKGDAAVKADKTE